VDGYVESVYNSVVARAQPGNYVLGANIAGFLKITDSIVAQGHLV